MKSKFLSQQNNQCKNNKHQREGSSLLAVLIANIIMCQSEELKCDSKFLKVHLLWVQRPCEVEDACLCGLAGLQAVLGPPAVHWWAQTGAVGMQRSPSDCCFSGTALLGLRKCTARCVCNFLCSALHAGHLHSQCTACVCTCAKPQCRVPAWEVMGSGFWMFYGIEP